jgi:hypothetical protein
LPQQVFDMACASCRDQRAKVALNFKQGNFAGAVKATATGFGMMAGAIPKKPKPKTTK